jgi:hypothetical protein
MKRNPSLLLILSCLVAPAAGAQEAAADADAKSVELPGADVVGNRELPIGLDIVPWRPATPGEVREGPTQLLDAPLRPIDPEVFRRELSIYESSQP